MALETWRLDHPEIGLIEFETGENADFLEVYPDWPGKDEEDHKPTPQDGKPVSRLIASFRRCAQLKVNGEPIRRYKEVSGRRIPLTKHLGKELSSMSAAVDRRKPNLKIQKGLLGDVQVVTFHQSGQVAELDPPPGSRGEAYYEAVQSSAVKRTLYPILAGMGKGGWAIAVLVLGPLVGRLIDWLLSFLPDYELPSLPPLPNIELPLPTFPSIDLPVPNFPDFNLPDLPDLPEWVYFLMEYSKIWVPVLIGIVLGFVALRNSKKSAAQKEKWQSAQPEPQPSRDELNRRLAEDIRQEIDRR